MKPSQCRYRTVQGPHAREYWALFLPPRTRNTKLSILFADRKKISRYRWSSGRRIREREEFQLLLVVRVILIDYSKKNSSSSGWKSCLPCQSDQLSLLSIRTQDGFLSFSSGHTQVGLFVLTWQAHQRPPCSTSTHTSWPHVAKASFYWSHVAKPPFTGRLLPCFPRTAVEGLFKVGLFLCCRPRYTTTYNSMKPSTIALQKPDQKNMTKSNLLYPGARWGDTKATRLCQGHGRESGW